MCDRVLAPEFEIMYLGVVAYRTFSPKLMSRPTVPSKKATTTSLTQLKKIAVIGPNAKRAVTRSARLLSTYSISLLEKASQMPTKELVRKENIQTSPWFRLQQPSGELSALMEF